MPVTVLHRFFSKVMRDEETSCWIWTAHCQKRDGYGVFGLGGKILKAHRFAYEVTYGPIGDGLEIDHLCRNTSCVNPGHLEAVTHQVNVWRGTANAAVNKAKLFCIHGHDLTDPAVTYRNPDGRRQCRVCRRAIDVRRYDKKRGLRANAAV